MRNYNNVFKVFPIKETNQTVLMEIEKKHSKDLFEIYSDAQIMKYMQRNPIEKLSDADDLILYWAKLYSDKKGIRWGIFLKKNPDKLIGTIALQYWRKDAHSIELGADLNKEYWGKGLITEVTKFAIDFAFENLGVNRIELRCNPQNKASIRITEKLGFSFEGTLREYVYIEGKGYDDESVYSLLRSEYN